MCNAIFVKSLIAIWNMLLLYYYLLYYIFRHLVYNKFGFNWNYQGYNVFFINILLYINKYFRSLLFVSIYLDDFLYLYLYLNVS